MRALLESAACGLVWAILVCFASAGVHAQSFQGGLRGTVKDAQGVVPGVTVTLTNEATGVSRETVSNEVGEYSFPAIDPGRYTVRAAVTGFKTVERKGYTIGTQQFLTLDLLLEVGAIEESITVVGESPLVETSNASIGDFLDTKTLESLPSVGRNAFLLSVTVPTVVSSGDTHWNRMQDQSGASALSMGGGGVRANNYLLDGFPVTDIQNRSSTNPSIEMLEGVKVQIHTYDAEMGRTGGGVFNASARSGTNAFRGGAFFTYRPYNLAEPNFFLKIRGRPDAGQFWRQAGGGVGGPLVRNRTFFYFAGEGYRDGLTQNGSLHFPTAAMRTGDFSNLTDAAGRLITIYDPLTANASGSRQAFSGNRIPANRINPVGANIVKYLPLPNINPNVDNSGTNYAVSDVIKDAAQQASGKVDHHFNDKIALSGVYLYQVTHEPQNNYFPDARFAAPSYQLDREIGVLVLNNTYVVNSSTVATLRFGWNRFDDNNNLPFDFDAHTLGFNRAFADAIPVQKFPSFSFTGYNGTGFTGKSVRRYYSEGINGSLTKLAGEHSFKTGADFRLLGIKARLYGQSAGTFSFNGQFTRANATASSSTSGNAIADLLLGYPNSGSETLNSEVNDYVTYSSVYVQDDWRMGSRLTVNYGLRLEHETMLAERDNKLVVGFDRNAVSPLNVTIPAGLDPLRPQARQVKGGLIYAGVDGAPTSWGDPPVIKPSPRVGVVFKFDEITVLRGGYGMFWAPWNTGANSPTGYSATTTLQQNTLMPITSIDNPFPSGLIQPSGNALGLASGASSGVSFVDPTMTSPRVQQYSVDFQRELPGNMSVGIGYAGSRGNYLDYGSSLNINQLPAEYASLGSRLVGLVDNPFFGNPRAGSLAAQARVQLNSLLVPFPQYGLNSVSMTTSGAHSKYDALILQLRKRVSSSSWWGGNFNYTRSRLTDNQIGQGNYYSSAPGIVDAYSYIPDSPIYNPDVDYGISLLDQPHKLIVAPIVQLPFGRGRAYLNKGGPLDYLVGGWTIAAVATIQSGFPIGVSQTPNTLNLNGAGQRPNLVSGADLTVPGDITTRLRRNPSDDLYLNPDAFILAPAFTFGNTPRILPGVRSPVRNALDVKVNKEFRMLGSVAAHLGIEVLNVTNKTWYAALASVSKGSANFGKVATQGNYPRMLQITLRTNF